MFARTTIGSILRSTQAHCGQICSKETLDHGIAFTCERYPTLREANQIREVVVDDEARLPDMLVATEQWFSRLGLTCTRWAPAEGPVSDTLRAFLYSNGFRAVEYDALVATHWPEPSSDPRIRILPARAMRQVFRETFFEDDALSNTVYRRESADAAEDRLDDPQWDMFVATFEGRPAGRCALYQVGDIARVMDLWVSPMAEGRGVADSLLCHVMTLAKRLAFRNVYAQVDHGQSRSRSWHERAGFVEDGDIVEFERVSIPVGGDG